jgi:hypothetical protein
MDITHKIYDCNNVELQEGDFVVNGERLCRIIISDNEYFLFPIYYDGWSSNMKYIKEPVLNFWIKKENGINRYCKSIV